LRQVARGVGRKAEPLRYAVGQQVLQVLALEGGGARAEQQHAFVCAQGFGYVLGVHRLCKKLIAGQI